MRVRVPVQVRVHVFLEVFDEGPGEDGGTRMIEVRRPCSRQYIMLRLSRCVLPLSSGNSFSLILSTDCGYGQVDFLKLSKLSSLGALPQRC